MPQLILLIDDSEDVHKLVRAILASEKYDVHSATEPGYGITLAASERPDLILLDVDMPGMNGFEVCKQLKANPETSGCPIMFLTSVSASRNKVEGLGIGAHDYVTKPFNPDELRARVKASLRTRKVIQSLEEQSLIDSLTGLGNRRMLDRRTKAENGIRIRSGNPLSLILLDIDQFKAINDNYGHAVGDNVLKSAGAVLTRLCRAEDVACRLGGDEFVILAPGTNFADAGAFAERIRKGISEITVSVMPRSIIDSKSLQIACSAGVAEATGQYDSLLLERADDAMYKSKRRTQYSAQLKKAA